MRDEVAPRGCALTDWPPDSLAARPGECVLSAAIPTPLDALRLAYLEAVVEADAPCQARLEWEDLEGSPGRGPSLGAGPDPVLCRHYLRDWPAWRGGITRVLLRAPRELRVRRFLLLGDRDLQPAEKLAWPSEFAVVPRARLVQPGEPVEARLIIPNRLLRILGPNHVVFTLESSPGNVLAEKRLPGRVPVEPAGATDFHSGHLRSGGVAGRLRLTASVLGAGGLSLCDSVAALVLRHAGLPVFQEPFHFLRDFCLLRLGDAFHLFYTPGLADSRQSWDAPRTARQFGHATSTDLCQWKMEEPVLAVERGSEEEVSVRAPFAVEQEGEVFLAYTSVDAAGRERLRAARSRTLRGWSRQEAPLLTPNEAWALPGGAFRSPCLLRHGIAWVLYCRADRADGRPCVASAVSRDLREWVDTGPVVTTQQPPEAPCVFAADGLFWMLTDGAGVFRSEDPLRGWEPAQDPRPQGWKGWEVVRAGGEWMAMAYRDMTRGGFAQAFPLRVRDGRLDLDLSERVEIEEE